MFFKPANPPIKNWQGLRVWLVGASSGIGESLAKQLDERGCKQVLSARSVDKLNSLCSDLKHAHAVTVDVTSLESVLQGQQAAQAHLGQIDLVILMAGTYSEMSAQAFDVAKAKQQIDVNLNGTMHMLGSILPSLLQQNSGHICIVSSVAGYRGLPNSLAYGPSKAALINLAEALHVELKGQNIGVSVVNPGFVDTPLTRKNTFPMPCLISPTQAASQIVLGLEAGHFEIHFPKAFTRVLRFLRLLPSCMYFALVEKFVLRKIQ